MANNVVDILQRILLEGDKAVTQAFGRIQDAGTSAFEAIGSAASKIAGPFNKFEADLAKVESRAKSFGQQIANVGSATATFATRVTAATAGLAAAGGLALRGVLSISTALKSVQASLLEQRLAASQNAAIAKKAVQTDFAQANAIEDLNVKFRDQIRDINDTRDAQEDLDRQLASGQITRKQFGDALVELQLKQDRARRNAFEANMRERAELQRTQQREIEQQRILAIQQEDIRREQAKDQAAAQQRAVIVKLEAQFGAALTSQLISLANVLDTVRQRFLSAFGPQIAEFMRNVIDGISNAAPAIFAQFDRISKAIQDSFKKSGLTIEDVIKSAVKFFGDLTDIVVKVVIPAFGLLLTSLQAIADIINSIFGTNFTAGTLVAAAVILKLTGLFGVLRSAIFLVISAVRLLFAAFGPWGILIGVIVALILEQLIPALLAIDWGKVAKLAQDAWNSIVKTLTDAVDSVKQTWNGLVAFFGNVIGSIIGFFDDLIKKVKEFLGLTGASNSSLASDAGINDIGKGFAGGGLFRGKPGRDTNLAWLTDREFVMNPRAVRYWGVDFMNSLNRLSNPLRGFNAGGLVGGLSTPMPRVAFAGGGLNRTPAGNPLTLVIDGQKFEGLTVQDDTANSLGRYAARRGIRSAGRKPLWFGGSR